MTSSVRLVSGVDIIFAGEGVVELRLNAGEEVVELRLNVRLTESQNDIL
jgi:hypothetical protein